MPTFDDYRTRHFFNATDVENGDRTLTIQRWTPQEIHIPRTNKKKREICLWFLEDQKGLLLSAKTNQQRIEYLHGRDFNGWVNKRITITSEIDKLPDGGTGPCLRIRTKDLPAPAPATVAAKAANGAAPKPGWGLDQNRLAKPQPSGLVGAKSLNQQRVDAMNAAKRHWSKLQPDRTQPELKQSFIGRLAELGKTPDADGDFKTVSIAEWQELIASDFAQLTRPPAEPVISETPVMPADDIPF